MTMIDRKKRGARIIGVTAALALTGSIAAVATAVPGHAATVKAAATTANNQRTATVDSVPLTIASPVLPKDAFQVSQPGDLLQMASVMQFKPYRDFSITAVPYGKKLLGTSLPAAGSSVIVQWRDLLTQADNPTSTTAGPTAALFGQTIASTITQRVDAPDGKTQINIETVRWVVDAGNRLWIVEASRDSAGAPAGFGNGMLVSSSALSNPTTMGKPAPASTAAPVAKSALAVQAMSNAVPLGGTLPTPSWWNGQCDSGNASSRGANGTAWNLGTSPHALTGGASYMGMQACGPTDADRNYGPEPYASMPGTAGFEWECAELSARYMVLRYGTSNPGEYGSTAANNFYNSYGKSNSFALTFNGTAGQAPQAGDIISWDAPTSVYNSSDSLNWGTSHNGHTAVVTGSSINSSGTGSISILQQNYSETGTGTVTVNNWVVQSVMGSPVGTINWLHNPADGGSSIPAGFNVYLWGFVSGQNVSGAMTLTAHPTDPNYINSLYYTITGSNGYNSGPLYPSAGGASFYPLASDTNVFWGGVTYTVNMVANETDGQNHTYFGGTFRPINDGNSQTVHTDSTGAGNVFSLDNNGFVVENNFLPASGWSGAQQLGPQPAGVRFVSAPNTLALPSGEFDVRVTGSDGNVWSDNYVGSWSGWFNLGAPAGGMIGTPVSYHDPAVSNSNIVYVTGVDGNLYERYWTGSAWSAWQRIGTAPVSFVTAPNLLLLPSGELDIRMTGVDGNVYSINYTGTWCPWFTLGSPVGGVSGAPVGYHDPTAPGSNVVYVTGRDGRSYQKYWTGSAWSDWYSIGGGGIAGIQFIGSPSVWYNPSSGTFDITEVATDGRIYQEYFANGAWGPGWNLLSGASLPASGFVQQTPVTFSNADGTFLVYAIGKDGNVWEDYFMSGAWSGWQMLPRASGLATV